VDALEIQLRRPAAWRRPLSWLVDAIPFAAFLALALRAAHAGGAAPAGTAAVQLAWRALSDTALSLPILGVTAVLGLVYQLLCHTLAGATLGKRLLGLRVVGPDGRRPSLLRSTIRAALSAISVAAVGLGVLLALFTVSGRSFHDLLARTWVVEAP
jgi:uncharacterized RDD family membrane protein YckC